MPLHGRWVLNQSPVALGITVPSESIWYNRGDGSDVFHRKPITPSIGSPVYVNEVVAVPRGVVTVTVTGPAPAEAAGAVILIVAAVFVVMVAAALPNVTEVAPARFVPVMLTNVPAASGPESGEMTVIVGIDPDTLMNVIWLDTLDPTAFVTISLIEKFPALNTTEGFWFVLNVNGVLFPFTSVAFHCHDVGRFVDVSVNWTVKGAVPLVGVALKPATGAGEGEGAKI